MTPPFPKTVDELAPWQVYADQLIERGDERGAYISRELSLSDPPSAEELAAFQEAAHSFCRSAPVFEVGWAMGHVRTLALRPGLVVHPTGPGPLQALADLAVFLKSPLASQLETLQLPAGSAFLGREWDALMAALPRSCTRLDLSVRGASEEFARQVLAALPPQIRQLAYVDTIVRLENVAWLVDDRIDELCFANFYDGTVPENLARRLEEHPRVRLRLGSVMRKGVLRGLSDRAIVGRTGDALLIGQNGDAIIVMPRHDLRVVQKANGIVPVRAQLNRSMPEQHSSFTRSSTGDWYVRSGPGSPVRLDFREVGFEPVPVRPDARVDFGHLEYRFHVITSEEATQRELRANL